MRKCWARSLGNCSDSLSREHTVTAGLFTADVVNVQGLSWCKDEPKSIGLANATRKILCETHNSALSPVDSAAIAAFDVFRECVRLTDARESVKETIWRVIHMTIDGSSLERWFLKTLINLTTGGTQKVGPKSLVPGEPSVDLIEIAFGLRQFVPNAGLYSSAEKGEGVTSEDKVSIIPFFDANSEYVLGGTFYFRGWRFMLHLSEEGFTGNVRFVHSNGNPVSSFSRPSRHLRQMRFTISPLKKRVSHVVDFKWQ
jgi:hypothetical protein